MMVVMVCVVHHRMLMHHIHRRNFVFLNKWIIEEILLNSYIFWIMCIKSYLFPLHASVLEPDFNLPLRQAETVSDFDPATSRQVAIKMKLLFQF